MKFISHLNLDNTDINNIFLNKSWDINPVLNIIYIFDDEEANNLTILPKIFGRTY